MTVGMINTQAPIKIAATIVVDHPLTPAMSEQHHHGMFPPASAVTRQINQFNLLQASLDSPFTRQPREFNPNK